jgi:polyisoprenoid-binding protein YceI
MNIQLSTLLSTALLISSFLLPQVGQAKEQKATIAQVGFHISHPAKKYDAKLLLGGATAVAHFDGSDLSKTSVDATIQVEYFNSDNELRDSHMMEVLEGIIFPNITWKGVATGVAATPITAGKHEIRVKGPLTVHGVTQEVEIPVMMEVAENGLITVQAKFSISLESYEIERPSLVFVKIADEVPINVKMVFPAGPELLAPPVAEPAPAASAEESPVPAASAEESPAPAAEQTEAPSTDQSQTP